jgi:aminopeptidase YwaD
MRKSKVLILVLALILMVTSIVFAAPNENAAGAFDRRITARVDGERALEHIRVLSEDIGPRVAGTEEEWMAANYIKDQFEKLGYPTEIQEVPISNVRSNLIITTLGNMELRVNTATGSGYTDSDGVTAEIISAGLGNSPEDFPAEVEGNIALVQRGDAPFAQKAENAVNAGAVGVIIYNNAAGSINPTLGTYSSPVPVVAITLADGSLLIDELQEQEVVATIKAEHLTKSWNVVATSTPKNQKKATDQIVHVSAHYDSVPFAPGANDNGSGTAMMLELARILKGQNIDKEVRFLAAGAEEIGLVGSRYYVNQLTEDEINRSLANFNMDMIATSWEPASYMYINTVDGQPNIVSESAVAAGARHGNDTYYLNAGGSSDHVPFHQAGIAAANFIRREPDTGRLEPWYHTPADTIENNISLERLQEAGEIIGSALFDVLRKDTPNLEKSRIRMSDEALAPFFIKGDQQ